MTEAGVSGISERAECDQLWRVVTGRQGVEHVLKGIVRVAGPACRDKANDTFEFIDSKVSVPPEYSAPLTDSEPT